MAGSARSLALGASAAVLAAGCGLGGGGITPIQTAFNRGVYHDSTGAYDLAIAEYRDALDEDPDDLRARFNLGAALEASAHEREAGGDLAGATALRHSAFAEYAAILRQVPDHPRASVNLAALEYETDPAAAKQRLRALIERHPERVLPRTALAAHLLAEGEPAPAAGLLEEALRMEPASFEANLLLGDARRASGDLDAARAAYGQALRRDGADLSALLALSRLEVAAARPVEAAVFLERVLYVDPDNYEALCLLAGAHEAEGDLEAALELLLRARRLPAAAADAELRPRLRALCERLLATEWPGGDGGQRAAPRR